MIKNITKLSTKIPRAIPSSMMKIPQYQFSTNQNSAIPIDTSLGISSYMKNIYQTSLLSFGGMMVGSSLMVPYLMPNVALIGGLVASLGGIIGFNYSQKSFIQKLDIHSQQKQVAVYSQTQKMCYLAFLAGGSMTLTPALQYAMMVSPSILPLSLLMTLGTFGGASLYAMNQPIGSFNKWSGPLFGALVSCLIMNLAGAGCFWMWGPNMFSNIVFSIYPYIGVGLFTAFQMFDTDLAMSQYKEGVVDPLQHSISMVLNLKNLLINFIQIFSRFNND